MLLPEDIGSFPKEVEVSNSTCEDDIPLTEVMENECVQAQGVNVHLFSKLLSSQTFNKSQPATRVAMGVQALEVKQP